MDSSSISMSHVRRALQGHRPQILTEAQRWAGVAAVLRDDDVRGPCVLLIQRSVRDGDPWSGHIAMPGGKQEPDDDSLEVTAIRETEEEVGLSLRMNSQLIGALDHTPAYARGRRTGMVIAPYVFEIRDAPLLSPNHEVQETLWVPLRELDGPALRRTRPYEHDGVTLQLPCWHYEGRVIWGLTYMMLDGLLGLVRAAAR